MSYVHDDQYASLLGRCVRDRAVLFGRSCGVPEVSILGEYLQRVKAERDEALKLLRSLWNEIAVADFPDWNLLDRTDCREGAMTTTESYGCDKHGEDAYQGCAMCDLERLAAEIERLRAERDALLRMLAEWCVAVDNDSSWDGWDHHYKYARYRPGPMRAALDAAIQEVIDEQARYDAVLAERKP